MPSQTGRNSPPKTSARSLSAKQLGEPASAARRRVWPCVHSCASWSRKAWYEMDWPGRFPRRAIINITLPDRATTEQVAAVLACCQDDTPAGRRDYSVLLLLARLGLRAH